jgi:hypothetical protein
MKPKYSSFDPEVFKRISANAGRCKCNGPCQHTKQQTVALNGLLWVAVVLLFSWIAIEILTT